MTLLLAAYFLFNLCKYIRLFAINAEKWWNTTIDEPLLSAHESDQKLQQTNITESIKIEEQRNSSGDRQTEMLQHTEADSIRYQKDSYL